MINLLGVDIDTVATQLLLPVLNGTGFFVDSEPMNVDEFSTDVCPLGAGGFFRGDLFFLNNLDSRLSHSGQSAHHSTRDMHCPCGT